MTKRRVQGGEATSERRRRDGVYQKSKRGKHSSFNFFCRLAATSANKVPRPSRYSIATATSSKRSSADSDLLLCHVRLWQTSRLEFGCGSGCEHSKIKFALHNTHVTPHPPLSRSPFCPSLGDADRVCSANRSIPHWRRLAIRIVSLKTKLRIPAFDNFHRMSKYKNVYEIWLMGFVSLLQWEKVAAVG